jgi:hypothetical protein
MTLPGITHEYGPWSPMRFIPVPWRTDEGGEPAFWVTTSRICRGLHDFRCAQAQTQTFGPLVLERKTAADVWTCPNCQRQQPPVDTGATGENPTCLFCTDMATVQHLGDAPVTATAAVSAVAALHAATGVLRQTQEADPDGYLALLAETGESLRSVMEDAAWAVKQDPRRSEQTVYAALAMIARQVIVNAKFYAALNTDPFEIKERERDTEAE